MKCDQTADVNLYALHSSRINRNTHDHITIRLHDNRNNLGIATANIVSNISLPLSPPLPHACLRLYRIAHRSQSSYPHATASKPIMKRRDSKESSRAQSFDTSITTSPSSTTTGTPITSPQKSLAHAIDEESGEPLVSQRAGHSEPHSDSDGEGRHVQFNKTSKLTKSNKEPVDQEHEDFDENLDETKKKIKG